MTQDFTLFQHKKFRKFGKAECVGFGSDPLVLPAFLLQFSQFLDDYSLQHSVLYPTNNYYQTFFEINLPKF